jgi:PAS domain S-box-containing protein
MVLHVGWPEWRGRDDLCGIQSLTHDEEEEVNIIRRLVEGILTAEAEETRQQRLLNILLAILVVTTIGQEVVYLALPAVGLPPAPVSSDPSALMRGLINTLVAVFVAAIVFVINRYWSRRLARFLFVLLLAASIFANTPDNWVLATLTFALCISVFIASFLLRAYTSFVVAGVGSIITSVAGVLLGTGIYLTSPFILFAIAMLSQIVARSLERTLEELRILNVELDRRVQDRTRELAESLSKTEAILESTADGIIVFDNAGKATVANPAVASLLTHPVYEIVGSDIATLMGDEVSAEDKAMIGEFLHGEEMQEPSVKIAWGKKILSASAAPVHLESGEDLGTVAVFRDFTKEAEVDRMKSTFVSLASHELRTPLNAIMGYAELLHEQVYGPLSDRQQDATKRILANTSHMLSLANNLLDRAQIEAGTLTLNVSSFSPAQVVAEAVSAMEILARNRGLELTSQATDDVPDTVCNDRQRVNQVVVNLIGNALKFTKEGGVHVSAYCPDKDHWAVAVSDTGIGIPKEAQEYIFEPFRQVDDSATREHSGAGLGLSIVKQLVEMMGGKVTLESELGQGSTFTIILPLTPSAQDEGERDKA